MLTIREALNMPVFAQAALVAGGGGLDNVIRWVHIVDVPDARYEWTKGGELLLTVGFGLRNNPQRQAELIPKLAAKGLAGIILSTGHYLDRVPDVMRRDADRFSFPVIELPPDVPFIDITEAIFSHITRYQYALQQRAEEIHHTLTRLVLDGGSLEDVAESLAGLLSRSITIENAAFELIAAAQMGPVDDARARSVSAGRTTLEVVRYLIDHGVYDRLLRERRPVRLKAMPDLGLAMERIVAPILVASQIMGYVWIIAGEHPLDDLDELAIQHGATVTALLMLKEQAVRDAKLALRGDLLEQLLRVGEHPAPALAELAHQFGFNFVGYYQALVVSGRGTVGSPPAALLERVERWLVDEGLNALAVPRETHTVVILHGARLPDAESLAARLAEALSHPAEPVQVGVGGRADELAQLAASYEQAGEALKIAQALKPDREVQTFDKLGVLHWLYHLPPALITSNTYVRAIRQLAMHDQASHAELLHTLEVYLDAGSVAADAADALYIHRNTLSYRLERIEQLMDIDLKEPDTRLNLHVALKAIRLLGD